MKTEQTPLETAEAKDPKSRRSLVPMLVWSLVATTIGLLVVVAFV